MSRSFVLPPRLALAALLRPLRRSRADGLLLPALRLGERIKELERMVGDE